MWRAAGEIKYCAISPATFWIAFGPLDVKSREMCLLVQICSGFYRDNSPKFGPAPFMWSAHSHHCQHRCSPVCGHSQRWQFDKCRRQDLPGNVRSVHFPSALYCRRWEWLWNFSTFGSAVFQCTLWMCSRLKGGFNAQVSNFQTLLKAHIGLSTWTDFTAVV